VAEVRDLDGKDLSGLNASNVSNGLMVAAVYKGPEIVAIEKVAMPAPDPDELLIEVRSTGICGSDLHAYHGRQPLVRAPRILGHELSGIVSSVGEEVEKSVFRIGDRVVAEGLFACGHCRFCRSGRHNICRSAEILGIDINGADAEYVIVPARAAHRIPDDMDYDEGALVEPAAVAAHAVERSGVREGDVVAITGMGPIGLLTLQMVEFLGPAKILVSDVIDHRLDLARRLGADLTVNAAHEDWGQAILEATNDQGADVVFEAVGRPETMRETIEIVGHGGNVVLIGLPLTQQTVEIDMLSIVMKELKVSGSKASAHNIGRVIELFQHGKLNLRDLISHRLPLEQAQRAFELADKKREKAVKVLFNP